LKVLLSLLLLLLLLFNFDANKETNNQIVEIKAKIDINKSRIHLEIAPSGVIGGF